MIQIPEFFFEVLFIIPFHGTFHDFSHIVYGLGNQQKDSIFPIENQPSGPSTQMIRIRRFCITCLVLNGVYLELQ